MQSRANPRITHSIRRLSSFRWQFGHQSRYTGLASSNAQCSDCTSDGSTRRLWYKHVTSSDRVTIPTRWARVQLTVTFILTAEMAAFVRLALLQDGPMPTKRVPTAFFGHFMRQPSPSGRSCSKPLLTGGRYCSRFTGARLWNRSVFMVFVQVANLSGHAVHAVELGDCHVMVVI